MFANRIIGGCNIPCVTLYIITIFAIIIYGYIIRKTNTRDILEKKIYHHPICQDIDGWSITHLIFFGVLGMLYPGNHLQFLVVGIGWEAIESFIGQNRIKISGKRLQLVGDQDCDGNMTGNDNAYWYGKESDIVVDMVGYCIGSALSSRYWPNNNLRKPVSYHRRIHTRACYEPSTH